MATHSSILAWRIPWTQEPGGLQSTGLQELSMSEQLSIHAQKQLQLRPKLIRHPSLDHGNRQRAYNQLRIVYYLFKKTTEPQVRTVGIQRFQCGAASLSLPSISTAILLGQDQPYKQQLCGQRWLNWFGVQQEKTLYSQDSQETELILVTNEWGDDRTACLARLTDQP